MKIEALQGVDSVVGRVRFGNSSEAFEFVNVGFRPFSRAGLRLRASLVLFVHDPYRPVTRDLPLRTLEGTLPHFESVIEAREQQGFHADVAAYSGMLATVSEFVAEATEQPLRLADNPTA